MPPSIATRSDQHVRFRIYKWHVSSKHRGFLIYKCVTFYHNIEHAQNNIYSFGCIQPSPPITTFSDRPLGFLIYTKVSRPINTCFHRYMEFMIYKWHVTSTHACVYMYIWFRINKSITSLATLASSLASSSRVRSSSSAFCCAANS